MIERGDVPKALLFYNQIMAMGGVSALIGRGYEVPGDVAVVSIDDSIDTAQMLVPTTTVALPFDETARHALYLCRRRMTNLEAAPLSIRVAPRLIVRESSGGGGD